MNQVLFRLWELVNLLSNQVWHLFSQGLTGKSMDKLRSSRSPMEEREMSTFLFLGELNGSDARERHWGGRGKV